MIIVVFLMTALLRSVDTKTQLVATGRALTEADLTAEDKVRQCHCNGSLLTRHTRTRASTFGHNIMYTRNCDPSMQHNLIMEATSDRSIHYIYPHWDDAVVSSIAV